MAGLVREVAEQERGDAEATAKALAEGKTPAKRMRAAKLREQLELAQGEQAAFADALRKSAQGLLVAAVPHVGDAIKRGQAEHEQALTRMREHYAAADAAGADVERIAGELAWLDDLASSPRSVEPYRERGGHPVVARLRRAVADDLAEFDHRYAEAERQRERIEQAERDEAAEYAAKRQRLEREDAERRVVYEGGVLVAKGGRPVRRGAFGVEPVGDDDEGSHR